MGRRGKESGSRQSVFFSSGDISRFKGRDLITPTEREARTSTRNHEDGLVVLAEQPPQQASAENILLKLGVEGLLIHVDTAKDPTG